MSSTVQGQGQVMGVGVGVGVGPGGAGGAGGGGQPNVHFAKVCSFFFMLCAFFVFFFIWEVSSAFVFRPLSPVCAFYVLDLPRFLLYRSYMRDFLCILSFLVVLLVFSCAYAHIMINLFFALVKKHADAVLSCLPNPDGKCLRGVDGPAERCRRQWAFQH